MKRTDERQSWGQNRLSNTTTHTLRLDEERKAIIWGLEYPPSVKAKVVPSLVTNGKTHKMLWAAPRVSL